MSDRTGAEFLLQEGIVAVAFRIVATLVQVFGSRGLKVADCWSIENRNFWLSQPLPEAFRSLDHYWSFGLRRLGCPICFAAFLAHGRRLCGSTLGRAGRCLAQCWVMHCFGHVAAQRIVLFWTDQRDDKLGRNLNLHPKALNMVVKNTKPYSADSCLRWCQGWVFRQPFPCAWKVQLETKSGQTETQNKPRSDGIYRSISQTYILYIIYM